MNLLNALVPELILVIAACVLFLLGATKATLARQAAPWVAMAAMMFGIGRLMASGPESLPPSVSASLTSSWFSHFVESPRAGDRHAADPAALADGQARHRQSARWNLAANPPEYFGLLLLSITGMLLVAGANDLITLFLGIELSSLPTYVMVSISRPLPAAQEAAVKYFFLGAFSAALTLLGLTFIFGTTGASTLTGVTRTLWVPAQHLATSGWLVAGGDPGDPWPGVQDGGVPPALLCSRRLHRRGNADDGAALVCSQDGRHRRADPRPLCLGRRARRITCRICT